MILDCELEEGEFSKTSFIDNVLRENSMSKTDVLNLVMRNYRCSGRNADIAYQTWLFSH